MLATTSGLILLVMLMAQSHAVVVLTFDRFDTSFSPELLIVSSGTPESTSSATLDSGATRSTSLTIGTDQNSLLAARITDGKLIVGANTGTSGRAVIDYDYSPLPGGSLDASGIQNVLIELSLADTTSASTLTLRSPGAESTVDLALTLGEQRFPIDSWIGVDFSQITGLTLDWEIGDSFDGEMRFLGGETIDPVPEPSTATLLLLGISILSRRQRK